MRLWTGGRTGSVSVFFSLNILMTGEVSGDQRLETLIFSDLRSACGEESLMGRKLEWSNLPRQSKMARLINGMLNIIDKVLHSAYHHQPTLTSV